MIDKPLYYDKKRDLYVCPKRYTYNTIIRWYDDATMSIHTEKIEYLMCSNPKCKGKVTDFNKNWFGKIIINTYICKNCNGNYKIRVENNEH